MTVSKLNHSMSLQPEIPCANVWATSSQTKTEHEVPRNEDTKHRLFVACLPSNRRQIGWFVSRVPAVRLRLPWQLPQLGNLATLSQPVLRDAK